MKIYNTEGKLLYECDAETIKETVEKAVTEHICLKGANFRGAIFLETKLQYAYLNGANFRRADLDGATITKQQADTLLSCLGVKIVE